MRFSAISAVSAVSSCHLIPLPIDSFLDEIVDRVRRSRAAVVTAAPGAGKTTRVPPALLADGPVILLQPRRVAARAIAARIADERGWTLGREVGWQVRFERRFSADTRLLVVTEGVLTARLQTDPLLSDFRTIVLDEFHERSVHADLAIALARQAWRARDDLRIVVMSATLESQPVSAFLDGCPVIDVPGRTHPDRRHLSRRASRSPTRRSSCSARPSGQVLCFLPGAPEIRRAVGDLQRRAGGGVEVVPLHGSLDAGEQDLALRPSTAPPDHRRDQHRRDVADRAGRDGRGRRAVCRRSRATTPSAASTASRPSASRRTPRISAPAAPGASRRAWCGGCGMRAIGCGRTASRRSTASICRAPCST